ncbi:MAG TPA: hypothetical protein DCL38_09210 [Lachnospiraceae bacterium]|nr:hypothetical protein [Lachnospiraceae bacterium]
MKNKYMIRIVSAALAVFIFSASFLGMPATAYGADSPSVMDLATRSLLITCLKDVYAARVEQTRVAREYLGSVKTLSGYNPEYASGIPAASERLENAIKAEIAAKNELEQAYGRSPGSGMPSQGTYSYNSRTAAFPCVYLTPGLSTIPVSVTVPSKKAYRVMINGIEAFSVLSTGRPSDPGSMLGLAAFAEPYAQYSKWHITAHFYGGQKLVDSIELSGEVSDPLNFRRLNDFVQIYRPGVEGATFHVYVSDNHSVMAAWNTDGTVTITDFNNYPQSPHSEDKKTESSSSSGQASKNSSDSSQGSASKSESTGSSSGSNTSAAEGSPGEQTGSSGSSSSSDTSGSTSGNGSQSSDGADSSIVSTGSSSDGSSGSSSTVSAAIANSNGKTISLNADTQVWRTEGGVKFHKVNNCSGMDPNKATQVSVRDAVEKYSLEACETCYN